MSAVANGLGITAEQGGNVLDAAMPELSCFDGGIAAAVLFPQRMIHGLDDSFDFR